MSQLLRVLYLSAAAPGLEPGDLDAILFSARRNNVRDGITGVLLYMDDAFMQVLEGPGDAVSRAVDRIFGDSRHEMPRVILREPVEIRRFASWSMGFHHLERWRSDESTVFELSHQLLDQHPEIAEDELLKTLILNFWQLADRHVSGVGAARIGPPRLSHPASH